MPTRKVDLGRVVLIDPRDHSPPKNPDDQIRLQTLADRCDQILADRCDQFLSVVATRVRQHKNVYGAPTETHSGT